MNIASAASSRPVSGMERSGQAPVWLLAVAAAAAHLPLLYPHAAQFLGKPHYQFAVLLPLTAIVLYRRLDVGAVPRRPVRLWLFTGTGLAAGLLCALAVRLWSPWLGAVSAMMTTLVVAYGAWGGAKLRRALPIWFLLWFGVGLPFQLDATLIQALRVRASRWTSLILDQFGVLHVPTGTTIRVPGHSYFVADACTGIHSLFVLLAFALLLGIWSRRNIVQTGLLMLATVGLVMIENVARLTAVVVLGEAGIDVATGWPHMVLGMAIFATTLGLVFSADRLLAVLVPSRFPRLLRRMVARREWNKDEEVDARSAEKERPPEVVGGGPRIAWPIAASLAALFLVVGAWSVRAAPADGPRLVEQLANPFESLRELRLEDMPPRIGPWLRKSYEFIEREVENPQGQFSAVWKYEWRGRTVEIAVDYPFPAIHDACLCFENTGWTIERQEMRNDPDLPAGYVAAFLSKPLVGEGVLLSSFLNSRGEFGARIYPRELAPLSVRLKRRIGYLLGKASQTVPQGTRSIPGPVVQIRLGGNRYRAYTGEDVERLETLYRAARIYMKNACLRRLNKE